MRLFFLFCFDFVIDFVLSECKNLKIKKKKLNLFVAERGSETLCYERVDSFGNLILAICKS